MEMSVHQHRRTKEGFKDVTLEELPETVRRMDFDVLICVEIGETILGLWTTAPNEALAKQHIAFVEKLRPTGLVQVKALKH